MDAFSMAISVGLQYGIPLESYVAKFTNMRFEPAGMTDDPDIRIASSMMDYIFRRLALDHLPFDHRAELGILSAAERAAQLAGEDPSSLGNEVDPVELAQSAAVETSSAAERKAPAQPAAQSPAATQASPASQGSAARPSGPHSTAELIELQQGRHVDAPLCLTCGTTMRPAGSCYVCEGCGSTSGCS
jgi:ribonucleoside-diphosphate reductase alpha chain